MTYLYVYYKCHHVEFSIALPLLLKWEHHGNRKARLVHILGVFVVVDVYFVGDVYADKNLLCFVDLDKLFLLLWLLTRRLVIYNLVPLFGRRKCITQEQNWPECHNHSGQCRLFIWKLRVDTYLYINVIFSTRSWVTVLHISFRAQCFIFTLLVASNRFSTSF